MFNALSVSSSIENKYLRNPNFTCCEYVSFIKVSCHVKYQWSGNNWVVVDESRKHFKMKNPNSSAIAQARRWFIFFIAIPDEYFISILKFYTSLLLFHCRIFIFFTCSPALSRLLGNICVLFSMIYRISPIINILGRSERFRMTSLSSSTFVVLCCCFVVVQIFQEWRNNISKH